MLTRFLIGFFVFANMAGAQSLDERLLSVSERLQKAQSSSNQLNDLDMDELSDLADELEILMGEMRSTERNLYGEQQSIEEEFYAESQDLMKIMGFITTYESQPAPDYILHPDGDEAAVQANIIIKGVMDNMQYKLADVAQRLKTWREIEVKETALNQNANSAFEEINRLRDNIVAYERNEAPELVTNEPMVLDALYAVSTSLNDFVGGLGQITMSGEEVAPFSMSANKGKMALPVYGEPIAHRQGVKIPTNDSFVNAPAAGTVRFVADFLDYGQTIILEPELDYLVIISGFDEAVVREGDFVQQNDIIGFFSQDTQSEGETETSPLRTVNKSLYVEARHNTVPLNVMDYFHIKTE